MESATRPNPHRTKRVATFQATRGGKAPGRAKGRPYSRGQVYVALPRDAVGNVIVHRRVSRVRALPASLRSQEPNTLMTLNLGAGVDTNERSMVRVHVMWPRHAVRSGTIAGTP
jgi:hypothetical protein